MPKISLSGPAELLTVIPFHLGFQPVRSVVVVCFHGKRLGLVARLDLVDQGQAAEAAAQTLPTLLQGAPSSVALVGFEDDPDESLPLLEALAAGVETDRVVVRERLVVHEGRWRSVGCDCCPDEGWLLPEQADVPAVAGYVALGHAVLPDRDGLARLVEPLAPSEPRHDLALAAIEDWQCRYAAAGGPIAEEPGTRREPKQPRRRSRRAQVGLGVLDGGEPTPRQFLVNDSLVAWGGVLNGEIEGYGIEHWLPSLVGPLRDVELRDALIGWLCPGTLPPDHFPDDVAVPLEVLLGPDLRVARVAAGAQSEGPQSEGVGAAVQPPGCDEVDWNGWEEAAAPRLLLSRLEQVCRLTPAAHAAPLLSVVASLAWWVGDGACAGVAADRALELEPDHSLSRLLRDALDRGVRPRSCA